MARALSNKQKAVLELLRDEGAMTAMDVSARMKALNPCPRCEATGEVQGERCRACYGWRVVLFTYSDAYLALNRLRKDGLVSRRFKVDEFGDEIPRHIYEAVSIADTEALEELWHLPSAERIRG